MYLRIQSASNWDSWPRPKAHQTPMTPSISVCRTTTWWAPKWGCIKIGRHPFSPLAGYTALFFSFQRIEWGSVSRPFNTHPVTPYDQIRSLGDSVTRVPWVLGILYQSTLGFCRVRLFRHRVLRSSPARTGLLHWLSDSTHEQRWSWGSPPSERLGCRCSSSSKSSWFLKTGNEDQLEPLKV